VALALSEFDYSNLLSRRHGGVPPDRLVLPSLWQCLVMAGSPARRELFRSTAENSTWQAEVTGDLQEFVRSFFRHTAPLTIVDMPGIEMARYSEFREAALRVSGLNDSLLAICASEGNFSEETWARQLGAWMYLPMVTEEGIELVFRDARNVIARRAIKAIPIEAPTQPMQNYKPEHLGVPQKTAR
jgi:hypothetical protein